MQKHLLLVAVLFGAIACTSENKASSVSPDSTTQESTLTPVENVPLSTSDANVYEYMSGPEGQMSVHIYSEDDIWIIEQNKIAEDGFPTPMNRWTFTTKEKAYAFATQKLGLTEAQRNEAALDKDPSGDVLFSENLNSGNVLWEAKNTWNWNWEVEFAKWMRANLHPEFFQTLGIENDCADAYYQARMIFSYENSLPVSFRLAGNGAYFTQNVVRPEWKKLKADKDWRKNQRFLKALDYVANTTYTHTLGRDTYPVEITSEGLIEGTAFLYLDSHSGHTLLVNEINLGGSNESKTRLPMYTLSSTVPKTVRPLYEAMFYESMQPQKSKYGNTGFVRFRWPKSSGAAALVDANKMPYYSEEQYSEDFMSQIDGEETEYPNFSLVVFKHLNPDFDPTLRITEGLNEVSEMMKARKDVVIEGYKVCEKGCVEGSADYENWSTPSRDKRIKALIVDLEKYQSALYGIESVTKAWNEALDKNIIELDGLNYVFNHVKWTFSNDFHSSDPNVPPGERWGLSPEAFAQAAARQLNPQLEARKIKINEKNDCKTSPTCLLFSNEYIAKSTFVEDQDIQRNIETRNQYCDNAGAALCENFKMSLASLPTTAPGHANFLETWEKIYLLNSDPTVTADQRWGAMPAQYNTLTVSGSYSVVGKYKNLILMNKDIYPASELAVLNEDTKKFETLLVFKQNATYSLNAKEGYLAVVDSSKQELVVYDLETMEKQSLVLPDVQNVSEYGFYSSVVWTKKGQMILNYQEQNLGVSIIDGKLVTDNVTKKNFNVLGDTGYLYKTTNIETDGSKPARWQISLLNMFDTSKPFIQFNISDVLGNASVSYISTTGLVTDKAAILQWSRYTDANTVVGYVRVDLSTGSVTKINDFTASYLSTLSSSVAAVSTYNENGNDGKTDFFFMNEDLTVDKKVTVKGVCDNCYEGTLTNVKVGADIYNIEVQKQELVKVLEVLGTPMGANVRINTMYGNFALVSYSDENLYYYALYDLKKQSAITTAESLSFTNTVEGIIPMIAMSQSYSTGEGETAKYYSLNLVYDIYNMSVGPIATPGNLYYGDEEGGEHGEFEGDGEVMAGVEGKAVIPTAKNIPFAINVLDPSAVQEKTDKVSIINMSSYQTIFIFK